MTATATATAPSGTEFTVTISDAGIVHTTTGVFMGDRAGMTTLGWEFAAAELAPAPARCTEHPAYDADYCPLCGTARVIGEDRD